MTKRQITKLMGAKNFNQATNKLYPILEARTWKDQMGLIYTARGICFKSITLYLTCILSSQDSTCVQFKSHNMPLDEAFTCETGNFIN